MNRSSEYTYTPAWWVPGAHLQTLWGKLFRRAADVPTRVERWTTADDDEIEIRRLDPPIKSDRRTPRLLLLHGLEGTIRSKYLLGTLEQARRRGWAADVLIFRGCGDTPNHARRFYHSGETTDLDFVVRRLVREQPDRPLVLAGFSLGANVLLKWLGEQGDAVPAQVKGAAAVSTPFDLARGSRNLERGFSRIYARSFLRTLREKAVSKLAVHPDLFDLERLKEARTLAEFDDTVTAPVHGFDSADDYYSRSSSLPFLAAIRRPTLLLSAFDDPFLPPDVLHAVALVASRNPNLVAEFHPRGGHTGFVTGWVPWRARYYAEQRIIAYLAAQLADSAFTAFAPM